MESTGAVAVIRARGVGAGGILVAIIATPLIKTLVYIDAAHSVSSESRITRTSEAPNGVGTGGGRVTIVATTLALALVAISASGAIALKSGVTGTGVRSRSCVAARGRTRAIRGSKGAIVDGCAGLAISRIPSVAGTGVGARPSVGAGGSSPSRTRAVPKDTVVDRFMWEKGRAK